MCNRTDIIITKTNKGGAIVFMDVKHYIKEAHRQLSNKYYDTKLNKELAATTVKLVNVTIYRFKKEKLLKENK